MKYEYIMRYKGRLKTEQEYGNIIISNNKNGQTLHLKDVADIELGGLQYSVSMKNNNQPSVVGMVQQIAGSNATQIASDVKEALAGVQKNMPPGMKVTIQQDVTEFLFCIYQGGHLHPFPDIDSGVHRCLCVLARLPFNPDTNDRCSSSLDRNLLFPMDVRIFHQLADTFSLAFGHCYCG